MQIPKIFEKIDVRIFIAFLLTFTAIWAFASIAGEVTEGETEKLDRNIVMMFRNADNPTELLGPSWLEESVRDITSLGSGAVLGLIVAAIFGFLLLMKNYKRAFLLAATSVAGALAVTVLKDLFQRNRPPGYLHLAVEKTLSFPSAHSSMSAVIYLTLALLLSSILRETRLRVYVVSVAVILTLMIGVSRVVLGLHYPTDVAAGWAFGFAWALLSRLALYFLEKKTGNQPGNEYSSTDI